MLVADSRYSNKNQENSNMRWSHGLWLSFISSLACLLVTPEAHAQKEPSSTESAAKTAWQDAAASMQKGVATIALRDQAQLHLPEGYGFIPSKEAARLMAAMGNQTSERFIGLIVPLPEPSWFVTVNYEASGYIKDDDAKNWDAKELLQNLRDGTEEGNKRRESMGIPPIMVSRWVEPPAYDGTTHRLVWSAEAKLKTGQDPDPTINYNTYVLGREGYISMDLITASSSVENDKRYARELLSAVDFNQGKRYTDFSSSTDKVAAYGLAALVGGIAAKKLGLLAALGVFIVKFAKVIAIGAAAFGGGLLKWFRGRKADSTTQ
jgi:uncharacterized membrane-anchored protein